jgi:hypothetical protein
MSLSDLTPYAAFSGWFAVAVQFFLGKRGIDASQYKNLSDRLTTIEKRSDECERDRYELRSKIITLESQLATNNPKI